VSEEPTDKAKRLGAELGSYCAEHGIVFCGVLHKPLSSEPTAMFLSCDTLSALGPVRLIFERLEYEVSEAAIPDLKECAESDEAESP